MFLRHRSPLGPLQIAGLPGEVPPGEPFEVTQEQGDALLQQGDLFEEVEGGLYGTLTVDDLTDLLRQRDLPTTGRKAELITRLEQSDQDGAEAPLIINETPEGAA